MQLDAFIANLETHGTVSDGERQILTQMVGQTRSVPAHTDLVTQGNRPKESSILLEGWTARYKILGSGKRQIMSLHVPGDFIDLTSFLLGYIDHGIMTLTRCTLGIVPHQGLLRITETEPHLTRLLWRTTMVEASNHREWLLAMGQLLATQHAGHLICELYRRLEVVGLAKDCRFEIPLTQSELGDVLGLSAVHVNRCIQDLRKTGLIDWTGKSITIKRWAELVTFCEFDDSYLQVSEPLRSSPIQHLTSAPPTAGSDHGSPGS